MGTTVSLQIRFPGLPSPERTSRPCTLISTAARPDRVAALAVSGVLRAGSAAPPLVLLLLRAGSADPPSASVAPSHCHLFC